MQCIKELLEFKKNKPRKNEYLFHIIDHIKVSRIPL